MKKSINSLIIHLVMFFLALSWLYPYIWMVLSSFKPTADIYTSGMFEGAYSLDNYRFLFESTGRVEKPFLKTLLNSLFISTTVTVAVTLSSMFIGFALAKMQFTGQRLFKNLLFLQMVFPAFMFIIPQFVLVRELGLLNTYSAMIVPFLMSAWGIFMISQSFQGTPNDYIHAAKIDNASLWQIMIYLMMPLNKAIIAIVALFTFVGTWDNFLWPLIVIQDESKMPLSVLLATFSKSYGVYVGPVIAGAVLQTIPIVVLFILFRKYFMQGMSLSLK
ncbi:carbohydrate ABC transporter permease [Serratia fonticola]|jgi:multiple sugar transport system permease protein|uniref:carbohydrate ABC transporter permease n=1 Tax=Serratia fonticola TaxID=47917 RepID=UPI0014154432|nr:carbohydrate ABC transporter permease [Serratia fonticola]MDK2374574.1 carbohydrate ABC transporter permease [Serratia fonticola]NXZ89060.1 carbohydrate ABC transporter permease [Serratia fonticola]NYA45841.1 carbohydrate ABC transporter permease [Serratia fonticola]QIP90019.1 sugar ABC transporter permease [Serratia fonticola]CAI1603364.1 Maltose transport system permease protein malG [Serratia fonticola]